MCHLVLQNTLTGAQGNISGGVPSVFDTSATVSVVGGYYNGGLFCTLNNESSSLAHNWSINGLAKLN